MDKKQPVKKIEEIDLFPGTLEEYADFKDEEFEIMDTGRPQKYIVLTEYTNDQYYLKDQADSNRYVINEEARLIIKLLEEGCSGLVHYQHFRLGSLQFPCWIGLPVRKKGEINEILTVI